MLYEGEAISWNDLRPGDRVKVVFLNETVGVEAVRVEVLSLCFSPSRVKALSGRSENIQVDNK